MTVQDKPKVLAAIATVLGDNEISIESVVQKATHGGQAEIVWVTHEAPGRQVTQALEEIKRPACRAERRQLAAGRGVTVRTERGEMTHGGDRERASDSENDGGTGDRAAAGSCLL